MKHFLVLLKKVILIEELRPSVLHFKMFKTPFIIYHLGLSLVLLLTAFAPRAQEKKVNLAAVDWYVQKVEATTPETLAHRLTAPFETDKEKVRAIFRWITNNISYNVAVYPRTPRNRGFKEAIPDPYDEALEDKSLNERVAYGVLRKKTALCNGYARLFKTLCDYAGIPSEIVIGYARSNMGAGKFRSNHTWNAVYIDSAWHLLDATWASGFTSYRGDVFIHEFNEYYFLTPPEQLIRSHYPEEQRWTLLEQPPVLSEYRNAPFKPTAFIKYTIHTFKPATGIVEAAVGDTIRFELETADVERDRRIAEDRHDDSLVFAGNATTAFLEPELKEIGPKTAYQYVVTSVSMAWLHLLYNGDVILRYRLNVRHKPNAEGHISMKQ